MYREGFARLRRAQESVPDSTGPPAHLNALGTAYREHALSEPAYYEVMFDQSVPGFRPSADALAVAETAFDTSTATVTACMEAGIFRSGDARELAKMWWAAAHGAVSLELAGHFAPEEAGPRYHALMAATGSAFGARTTDDGGRTA
ncbi:TetR-like C-terminal domain-containing protein [Streptomyces sp. NPDC046876]|uniref:TetR-like C-terminal domain-containing protein n=1 Tax=Streptomyces sp. NPDC046876 TaxID=3155616 RepID=UPI0033C4FECD